MFWSLSIGLIGLIGLIPGILPKPLRRGMSHVLENVVPGLI
jgi:hypothetical protein